MCPDFQPFEQRKKDHVKLALDPQNQAAGQLSFDSIALIHDSLPDLNLDQVSIACVSKKLSTPTPFFVAGMTAGHSQAESINSALAAVASERGWVFGLGSQRRELESAQQKLSYQDQSTQLKKRFPQLKIISNIGIAQVIEAHQNNQLGLLIEIAQNAGASLLGVHLNPLQEAIQPEGTPNFSGSLAALKALSECSPLPLLIKETGCGISAATAERLSALNLFAVDVSGLGGTHWGRIEGKRAEENSVSAELGITFQDWGTNTIQSVQNLRSKLNLNLTEVWASGGVRTGLDAAKLLALGATRVGFAMPALQAAMQGEGAVELWMEKIESELKVALFCTNSANLTELTESKLVKNGSF